VIAVGTAPGHVQEEVELPGRGERQRARRDHCHVSTASRSSTSG
jgi:hypothetical protein